MSYQSSGLVAMFPCVLFCVWYRKEKFMAEKANNTPSWFENAIKNQEVSKEVLMHFKTHYLKTNELEVKNEKL